MNDGEAPTLSAALASGNRGEIGDWVHDFLVTVGKNPEMAEGLRLERRYWLGPILMDLERLPRCCGPEPDMEYRVDPKRFDEYVGRMIGSIRQGWEPPPLIASYDAGRLSVRDGNHRHEALVRNGCSHYWVIIWCNSEDDYRRAYDELVRPEFQTGSWS